MTRVIVNTKNPGARIAPEIYGQFAEHLGHCIYGGIYVGEDSSIPNIRGLRKDVIEALKALQVPVLRWPGGCFADEYHWMDGIGPKEERPTMVNSHWGGVVENNHFGTHEFMDLCELIGADAYINGNLGSGTVQEMQQWVEYLTCPDLNSPMAKLRADNGRTEPWKVKWFGVGNENWGCGGNMCPDYYAQEYKRYQTYVRNFGDNKIERIACGPSEADYGWMESLMKHARNQMDHISVHKYTIDGPWDNKSPATGYNEDGWYRIIHNGIKMDDLLHHHLSLMDRYDPDHRIGLIVDEWGTWHQVEPGTNPGFLFQQNTMRDAMLAAFTLDIFHRYADRITMANIAQMINVLQAMILTDDEKMVLTPTYHLFDLYKNHQNARVLDSWHDAGPIRTEAGVPAYGDHNSRETTKAIEIPGLTMSASQADSGAILLTLANPNLSEAMDLEIELTGIIGGILVEDARLLRGQEGVLDSHNTFEEPENVKPVDWHVEVLEGGRLKVNLPEGSVLAVQVMPEG